MFGYSSRGEQQLATAGRVMSNGASSSSPITKWSASFLGFLMRKIKNKNGHNQNTSSDENKKSRSIAINISESLDA